MLHSFGDEGSIFENFIYVAELVRHSHKMLLSAAILKLDFRRAFQFGWVGRSRQNLRVKSR
jgi:hypothetical protein